MSVPQITIIGDYTEPARFDFDASLSFSIKSDIIRKETIWQSKNITAEFFGDFWKHILDIENIKETVHFICAELLENAVNYSMKTDYLVFIQICYKSDEMMIYVCNSAEKEKAHNFIGYINSLLEAEDLQKIFIRRLKQTKETSSKNSQVGLITILKDRGAKMSWKFEEFENHTKITALARLSMKGCLK